MKSKEIKIKLNYIQSEIDKERGLYIGGVQEPRFINELCFDIGADYDFNIDTEEFVENGRFLIDIIGTKRALKEFGKFLINISMYQTEDEDYHEHIDQLYDASGNHIASATIRIQNI